MTSDSVTPAATGRPLGKTNLMAVQGGEVTADAARADCKHPERISPSRDWFALFGLCQQWPHALINAMIWLYIREDCLKSYQVVLRTSIVTGGAVACDRRQPFLPVCPHVRLTILGCVAPVTRHVELQYHRVVDDPVYRCRGRHRIGEHLLPLTDYQVRGDAQ